MSQVASTTGSPLAFMPSCLLLINATICVILMKPLHFMRRRHEMVQRPRLDPRLAQRLVQKKATLDTYRPLPRDTVRRLNEDLRVFLTYHSNAIEGNTLSLQETRLVIDYGITVHSHPLREYLEATNHAQAYSFVTGLVERREQITRETI